MTRCKLQIYGATHHNHVCKRQMIGYMMRVTSDDVLRYVQSTDMNMSLHFVLAACVMIHLGKLRVLVYASSDI